MICSAFWIELVSQVTLMLLVLPKVEVDTTTPDGAVSAVPAASTLTMMSCVAVSSAISVAVTVMVAMPSATPVMVTIPMSSTSAVAYIPISDITDQVSVSSMSASVMVLLTMTVASAVTVWSAISAPAVGAMFVASVVAMSMPSDIIPVPTEFMALTR